MTRLEVRPDSGRAAEDDADSGENRDSGRNEDNQRNQDGGESGSMGGSDKAHDAGLGKARSGTAAPARKPAGPDNTDSDPRSTRVAGDQDSADLPAPRPTYRTGPPPDQAQTTPAEATVIRNLLVGEAKSALVGVAEPSAAAVTRMVSSSEKSRLSRPLVQQAPPDNAEPAKRDTPAAEVGPLLIDNGKLTSHAKSACGTTGEATRAAATLGAAVVADHRDDALVVVPERVKSLSTTALQRRGTLVRAEASIALRTFELLDGAVRVRVKRPPMLATSMSVREGGDVRYVPALLEVSGKGIQKTTLSAPGDSMEMTFSDRVESGAKPARGLTPLPAGPPLTLPEIPGAPSLGADKPAPESASADKVGTTVTISLGKLRQAADGSAVAARASAVEIAITERSYGQASPAVALDLTIGDLESAAVVAPSAGGVAGAVSGRAGGLPVTGPGAVGIALGGAGLVLAGVAAMTVGMRRNRRFRA
ncbi:MAG TPA: hypothetical protein VFH03_03345 [Actinoplanes sp.]|nr:hypothetical protein [Actinoplanes sp.]